MDTVCVCVCKRGHATHSHLVIQSFSLPSSSISTVKPLRALEDTGRDISIFLVIRGHGAHLY